MTRRPAPLEFFISTHAHLHGVRLSLRGDFCNIPFDDDFAASSEAFRIAGGKAYSIERKSFPALRSFNPGGSLAQ